MTVKELFSEKCIIGMVHLLPLPGTLDYDGDVDKIYTQAIADAKALEAGGASALIVENMNDIPAPIQLSAEQFAFLAAAAARVRDVVSIPVGIDAAFCDWKASIAIAKAVKADFVRLAVFVDQVVIASGQVNPCCREAVKYRKELDAEDILFLCDAQVKHSFMKVPSVSLIESAKMAEENGADAIIVTGASTGQATPIDMIKSVRDVVKVPVLAGSGFSAENCASQLPFIDGAIVGSSFKEGGVLTNPVDENRVKKLMKTVRENS